MAVIEQGISDLVAQGFFDYVLPFLLVFFVVYAILQQTKVLGAKPGIDAAVSVILGLFMLYFARVFLVGRFIAFFSGKTFITLLVLMFALMISTFVYRVITVNEMVKKGAEWKYALVCFGLAVGLVALAFNSSPDSWQILFGTKIEIDNNVLLGVAIVAGIVGLISIMMSGDGKPEK